MQLYFTVQIITVHVVHTVQCFKSKSRICLQNVYFNMNDILYDTGINKYIYMNWTQFDFVAITKFYQLWVSENVHSQFPLNHLLQAHH